MKVLFATPCYGSAVSMNYAKSMFGLASASMRVGLECSVHMHSEALLTRSRNRMVAKFLEEIEFTHLFWIDADVAFSPEAAFRVLLADRDVAAGIYPRKVDRWPSEGLPAGMTREEYERRYALFPFNPIGHGGDVIGDYVDADGFVEVAEAPTGFMAIKRHVFNEMMTSYPHLSYRPGGEANNSKAHLYWLFFDCMVDPESHRYLTEDYAFCRRWRDIGGKVYIDLHSKLQHLGQRLWKADFAESLKAQGRL